MRNVRIVLLLLALTTPCPGCQFVADCVSGSFYDDEEREERRRERAEARERERREREGRGTGRDDAPERAPFTGAKCP